MKYFKNIVVRLMLVTFILTTVGFSIVVSTPQSTALACGEDGEIPCADDDGNDVCLTLPPPYVVDDCDDYNGDPNFGIPPISGNPIPLP